MHDVKGLWRSVLGELEVSVTRGHYLTWLKPTYIVSNESGRVVVGVPNIFNKQWLENKYHSQIKEALAKLRHSAAHYVDKWRQYAVGMKPIDLGE